LKIADEARKSVEEAKKIAEEKENNVLNPEV
jgi:hypothetical protein